jgi:transposase
MKDLQLYQQLLGLREPWYVAGVRLDIKAQEVEVTVAVPWAEKYGRFSKLNGRLAIELMLECSVAAACQILRLSWDEADRIKQRSVARGLARKQAQPAKRLGGDAKSAGRGQNYVTVVARLESGQAATVEYVGDGRKQEALDGYWRQIAVQHRAVVEAVAMDLWEPYFNSTRAHVPQAAQKIVPDPYHLGRMLSEAVDKVRKAEHRVLAESGDEGLAGSKYLWLYAWEKLPEVHQERFDQLRGQRLKTSRAWALKEMFRDEGLNNRIAGLVKKAFGYRNRERFKTDILFHLGGLDLYPSQ